MIGNVFSPQAIERCMQIEYNPEDIIPTAPKAMGIDPAWGSNSGYGICVIQLANSRLEVIHAEEYYNDNAEFNLMLQRIKDIETKCFNSINNIYVDAANKVLLLSLLKIQNITEHEMQDKLELAKKYNTNPSSYLYTVPVGFGPYGKEMLQHSKMLVEDPRGIVAIDKRFDKLIIGLRTAVSNEYSLDKKNRSMQHDDVLDAFRLALRHFEFK
ncbi:hypothetical protein BH18THE2_BH18THE2_37910 [soil metagenome]